MKNIALLFLLLTSTLYLSCSGSKDFDEIPTPIGGDIRVQEVLMQAMGSDYHNIDASIIIFNIIIDETGKIKSASIRGGASTRFINDKIKKAMIEHIRFTPATKDGKPKEASFKYVFYK